MEGSESMIIMRVAEIKDIELLQDFIAKNNVQSFKSTPTVDCFLVIETKKILGFTQYKRLPSGYAVVETIYITPEERGMGLGDGLLRATLNYLMQQAVHHVILLSTAETDGFYQSEHLIPLIQTEAYDNLVNSGAYDKEMLENAYFCDINSFFNRKCKGSKGL